MLDICADASQRLPVVLMVYANVVLAGGAEDYVASARPRAGASGLIVPDLPHDESAELRAACDAAGIALVALVAPTTTPERLTAIGADARGFVYVVSLAGTTGERGAARPAAAGAGGADPRGHRRCRWRWASASRPAPRPPPSASWPTA